MYESFYGLRKRPFAAAPDADVMVETPAVADVVARIDRCVRHGRGVAVMTAAAGLGKTQLCQHFVRRFGADFRTALLPNASFPARRGFLQAILAELDQPFQKLGETELRLELTAIAKAALSNSNGVVLVLDEAHRYSEKILDEVRLVANLIENGEPLIRVILSGHTELEDRLAEPGLSGLNERVGELVSLTKLTAEESRTYLTQRTSFAGGSLDSLFDAASVALLVRACGGVPRCLNQLADHALLLGYVAERRPVNESLVREALDDLKRLPLQWHDPLPESATEVVRLRPNDFSRSSQADDDIIEIGGLTDDFESNTSSPISNNAGGNTPAAPREVSVPVAPPAPAAPSTERPQTEPILDRFARIDAAERKRQWFETLECSASDTRRQSKPIIETAPAESLEAEVQETFESSAVATAVPEPRPTSNPLTTLDRIVPLLAELEADFSGKEMRETISRRVDGGVPRVADARAELERLVSNLESAVGPGQAVAPQPRDAGRGQASHAAFRPAAKGGARSTLFSDLRRKQNEISSE